VTDVHHVHIWSLTGGHPVITLHAVLADGADHNQVLADLHRSLKAQFGISHATIQLERGHCPDDAGEPAA
jgi:cobalt-zinc-cadmium efflux system protein